MANPYHDEQGRFCSKGEMGAALARLEKSGDVSAFLKLRQEFQEIEENNLSEEEVLEKTNPLATQNPPKIDNALAEIYDEYYKKADELGVISNYIKSTEQALDPNYRYYRGDEYSVKSNKERLAKHLETKQRIEEEAAAILAKTKPYDDEFTRRGGWTRAFLVDNNNGHVHKSRSCSTCNPTTRFVWLPDYSAATEEQIVDDAGKSACTECYPTAPVGTLKQASKIEAPARKAARLEREAAAAVRNAKAAEKSIFTPDGKPLVTHGYYGQIKSARTAEIEAVDTYVQQRATADGKVRAYDIEERESDFHLLVSSLAAKHGRTYDAQEALIREKGDKKYKKEWL